LGVVTSDGIPPKEADSSCVNTRITITGNVHKSLNSVLRRLGSINHGSDLRENRDPIAKLIDV